MNHIMNWMFIVNCYFFLSSMQTFFWFNHVEKMFGYGHVFIPIKIPAYFLLLCFRNDKDISTLSLAC